MAAHIRLARPGDAPGVQAIYSPIVRDTVISFEYEPPAVAEIRSRIEATLPNYPWLVCDDGGVEGYAYAGPHRARAAYQWAADVSIYIAEGRRRRGLGRALYAALMTLLEAQGVRQVCAGITIPNEASVALHESLGFARVALYPGIGYKSGAWHAVGWWQRELGRGATGAPTPFVSLPELPAGVVAEALAGGTALL